MKSKKFSTLAATMLNEAIPGAGDNVVKYIDAVFEDPNNITVGLLQLNVNQIAALDMRKGLEADGIINSGGAVFNRNAQAGPDIPVTTFWDVCAFAIQSPSEMMLTATVGPNTYNIDLKKLRDWLKKVGFQF